MDLVRSFIFFHSSSGLDKMGTQWGMNMAGIKLGAKDMGNIPHPLTELHIHVATKTVQAGGIMGSLIVAPTMTAIMGPRDMASLKGRMETCGKYGVMIGLVAGPLLCWQKLRVSNASQASIWDRCYRLRYNRSQVRVDQLSLVGALAGYGAATYLGDSGALGAIMGMSGGVIFAAFLNAL